MKKLTKSFTKSPVATCALTLGLIFSLDAGAAKVCTNPGSIFGGPALDYTTIRDEVETINFNMPGMKIGSVTDPTLATGATLFYFPRGARANYDARGGSVAAIETTLLDESSYDNLVDGIMFSGGSTMGLEASQGARRRIFNSRDSEAGAFDLIPSVPGAVVYDYGGRIEPGQDPLLFPNLELGAATFDNAVENRMLVGRVGAGTSTTANKVSDPIWGGQGGAFKEINLGGFRVKIFTAVILNPHGDITLPPNTRVDPEYLAALRAKPLPRGHKQNTTLSLVVTDVELDRNQLKRLAMMVHTGMARSISPFHGYTDGDICFAVSLGQKRMPMTNREGIEEALQIESSNLMLKAISKSITVANKLGTPE